jgi:hypothetical protein
MMRREGKVKLTAGIENGLDVLGELRSGDELLLELLRLGFSRNLSGEEVPEHGFGEHLLSSGSGGKDFLALGDRATPEADTLLRVENRRLPKHGLDSSHTTEDLLDGNISENLVTVGGTELLGESLTFGDDLGESLVDGLRSSSRV